MFEELFRRARRVAMTHNGKNYPRIVQIEAMQSLQAYINFLEKEAAQLATQEQIPAQDAAPSSSPRA